ncbi:MAG: triosephosphate isomerase [Myxococcota bacterium]|jgi:triosephosphate isomerase
MMNIIGGNWKMNGDLASCESLAGDLRRTLGSHHGAEIVVFPPAAVLVPIQRKLANSAISVGAQDIHPKAKGAYTSGLSAPMVASIGCQWTLVGHSERREWFGDSDARVAEKLHAALEHGLKPILCIGETLAERQSGRTDAVLHRQLSSAFAGLGASELTQLVLAYEPVWAIGTGVTASPDQAQATHASIRAFVASELGDAFASALRIQYGGSVKPGNAAALMACPDINGALVGGASLDARDYAAIVRAATRQSPLGGA